MERDGLGSFGICLKYLFLFYSKYVVWCCIGEFVVYVVVCVGFKVILEWCKFWLVSGVGKVVIWFGVKCCFVKFYLFVGGSCKGGVGIIFYYEVEFDRCGSRNYIVGICI